MILVAIIIKTSALYQCLQTSVADIWISHNTRKINIIFENGNIWCHTVRLGLGLKTKLYKVSVIKAINLFKINDTASPCTM